MPLYMVVLAFVFCGINGFLQCGYLLCYGHYSKEWCIHPQFIFGKVLTKIKQKRVTKPIMMLIEDLFSICHMDSILIYGTRETLYSEYKQGEIEIFKFLEQKSNVIVLFSYLF